MYKDIDKTQNRMVGSPGNLELVLDASLNAVCYDCSDLIYRGFLWLAFTGLPDVDAVNLSSSDVHLSDGYIESCGTFFPIYDEAAETLDKLVHLNAFNIIGREGNAFAIQNVRRSEGDKLLRSIEGYDTDLLSMRSVLRRKFKEKTLPHIDPEIYPDPVSRNVLWCYRDFEASYNRIRRSGMYYRFYEAISAGANLKRPAHFTKRTDYSYDNWLQVFHSDLPLPSTTASR